jgi:hypothetical protein
MHTYIHTHTAQYVQRDILTEFMNTYTHKSIHTQYAKGRCPTVFQMEIGAIDRGADVAFLSQYPAENEILFPPLSFIEVVGNVR